MTMSPSLLPTRRHFAIISGTVMPEFSSMRIDIDCSDSVAPAMRSQSVSSSVPMRSFLLSMSASLESIRVASCSRDISSWKMTTVFPLRLAAFTAMFRAMAVLPMPGRAASRIRSLLLSPPIY